MLHYILKSTSIVPTGTVTFHRQVLKKPAYLSPDERLNQDAFCFRKVTVDSTHPLEEAPPGALQLDFANKNIGGGTLEKVQNAKHRCVLAGEFRLITSNYLHVTTSLLYRAQY